MPQGQQPISNETKHLGKISSIYVGLVDFLYEDASILDDYAHIFGDIKEDGIYMLNFHIYQDYEGFCDDGEWSVVKVENE